MMKQPLSFTVGFILTPVAVRRNGFQHSPNYITPEYNVRYQQKNSHEYFGSILCLR
ncbi:hypothetical protein GBAR_LOCUS22192, partial [Geodia barretti]